MPNIPALHLHLPGFTVGGTEQWALSMAKVLPPLGWRLSATPPDVSTDEVEQAFAGWPMREVEGIPRDALIVAPWDFERLAPFRDRLVAVAHGMNDYYKSILRGGDYLRGVAVAEVARQAFPAGKLIEVIHNGVDPDRLVPHRSRGEVRAALDVPHEALVVGFVGRWGVGKNPLAIARAAAAIPGAVALYIGPWEEQPALAAEAAALAPCRFVSPAQARHIGDFYAAMDVCVIASRTEGFSLVAVEAWLSRVPLVSTPVGVVLEHPELAVALPPDPAADATAAAVRTAIDPSRSPAIEEAERTARACYTVEAMGQRWRAYLKALAREMALPGA
jgi:glycosyltransferase involved in cell wall biosynthesis